MRSLLSPLFPLVVWAFFLPLQTRYFLLTPELHGGVVEYGITSIYLVPLFCFLWFLLARFSWFLPASSADFFSKSLRTHQSFIVLFFGVFFSVFLITILFSLDWRFSIAFLFNLLFAAGLVLALIDQRVALKPVLLAFLLGLIPSVLLGLFQVVLGYSPASSLFGLAARDADRLGDSVLLFDGVRILRAYGFFPHPNIFGGYLAIGILGALHLFFSAHGRERVFYGFLFTILCLGLLLTASRSAVLASVLGGFTLVFFFFCTQKYRVLATFFSLVVTLGVFASLFVAPSVVSFVRGGGVLEQKSVSERVQGVLTTPLLSPARAVFGAGPGNTIPALSALHPAWSVWQLQPPHVVWLVFVVEFGFLGLSLACIGFFLGLRFLYQRFLPEDSLYISWMHALFAISLFDHYLGTLYAGMVLVAFVFAFCLRGRML